MAVLPINDNTPVSRYTVAGAPQSAFPFAFWVDTEDSLNVYLNSVLATLNVDYTVTGLQQDAGGTVTLATPAAVGVQVVIERDTDRKRLTGLSTNGKFDADTINLDLTRLIAIAQELNARLNRGLQYPVTAAVPAGGAVLPTPVANFLIGWNAAANGLENKSAINGVTLPAFAGNEREFVRVNPQGNNLDYQLDTDVLTQLLSPVRCLISAVDTAADSVTTSVAHGLATAAVVRVRGVDGGVLPAPLSNAGYYNVRSLASNSLAFFTNAIDANNNTNRVNLTTTGSGRIEVIADPVTPANGLLWASDFLRVRLNNGTIDLVDAITGITLPRGHRDVAPPVYVSNTQLSVARFACRDGANQRNIIKTTSTTVDISVNGLNGTITANLFNGTIAMTSGSAVVTGTGTTFTTDYVVGDVITANGQSRRIITISSNTSLTTASNWSNTVSGQSYQRGGRAINTWYNLYAVTDGVNAALALSTRNAANGESLTDMPPGYTFIRQLPFACLTDGSGNILPFLVADWQGGSPTVFWRDFDHATAPYSLLVNGAATSYTAINVDAVVPPISRKFKLWNLFNTSSSTPGNLRVGGTSVSNGYFVAQSNIAGGTGSVNMGSITDWPLNGTNRTVEYKSGNGATGFMSLSSPGFSVTEVA